MSNLKTILALKLKQYYGPLRVSASTKVSAIFLYLMLAASTGGGALAFRIFYGAGSLSGFLLGAVSTGFSTLLAVGVYIGMKGGVTALQPEIDFILPAAIKPSTYLLADLLFQYIFLNAALTPILASFTAVILYPSPLWRLGIVMAAYQVVLLLSSMLAHILGVLKTKFRDAVKLVGWSLFAAFLAPAVTLILGTNLTLPYPSTLLAELALGSLSPWETLLLTVYLMVVAVAYFKVLRINFFTEVTPLLTTAFMESPPSRHHVRIKTLSLKAGREPLTVFMLKLHLLRVLRDGSLFTALLFLLIFAAANLGFPSMARGVARPELAALTLTVLYTPLIPSLLAINWGLSERGNLWLTATSSNGLKTYVKSLLPAYILVAMAFSTLFYGMAYVWVGGTPFLTIDMLLVFSMPIFSSCIAVLASLLLPRPTNALSYSSLLHTLVPMGGAVALASPILVIRMSEPLAAEPPLPIVASLVLYVTAVAVILSKLAIASATRLPERIGSE